MKIKIKKIKILSLQASLPSFPPSPKKHFLLQTFFLLCGFRSWNVVEIHTREKEFLVVHYITKRFAPRPKEGRILSNVKFL